jgi:hypothetical protein
MRMHKPEALIVPERGCWRFSVFTTTAYPLRVERGCWCFSALVRVAEGLLQIGEFALDGRDVLFMLPHGGA